MNLQTRYSLTAALLALAAVSTPALSQGTGWYAGLGLGQSTAKGTCEAVAGAGVSCDDTGVAFKLLGGYQFNQNFGAELGYVDLGKVKATSAGGNVEVASKGFELLGVGAIPINPQWSVYGKLGFFRWNADLKDGTGGFGSASENGTDLTYGFGVRFDFMKNLALRMEHQQYKSVGNANTIGKSDIAVNGVAVIFKF